MSTVYSGPFYELCTVQYPRYRKMSKTNTIYSLPKTYYIFVNNRTYFALHVCLQYLEYVC